MDQTKMTSQIATGRGFIAALDQSGGSTPKALSGYGIEEGAWSTEEEMLGLIHGMRARIVNSPAFSGDNVIGAILFERTMDGEIGGKPVPDVLKAKGVVPFVKIDKGLEAEADGVQLMKPMPELDALLTRARGLGVFGTKERSVINGTSRSGIAAIVRQQFGVAEQVAAHGLMPIIEPEVSIKLAGREAAEAILLEEILSELDALPEGRQVMLKLTLPAEANLYAPLVDHPRVLRVVALSGGFSREEACRELARNRGVIASFSRALLEELRHAMSDEEFDATLGRAVEEISRASTEKVAA